MSRIPWELTFKTVAYSSNNNLTENVTVEAGPLRVHNVLTGLGTMLYKESLLFGYVVQPAGWGVSVRCDEVVLWPGWLISAWILAGSSATPRCNECISGVIIFPNGNVILSQDCWWVHEHRCTDSLSTFRFKRQSMCHLRVRKMSAVL